MIEAHRTHHLTIAAQTVRKRYVSWNRGEPDREWAALTLLAEHAPHLAPVPIDRTVDDGRPVVVMSRLRGATPAARLDEPQTRALAAALLRLFSVPVPLELPVRISGSARMPDEILAQLSAPGDLSRCLDSTLVSTAMRSARTWLGEHRPAPPTDRVLGMGDGNLANFLWDGTAFGLVDFEDSGVSDLTFEVADLVEHASSRLRRALDVDLLVEALQLTAAQQPRLQEHRALFACFWLAMLLPGGRGFHRNPPGSTEDQAAHVLQLLG